MSGISATPMAINGRDMIKYDGKKMAEEEYIISQGNIPSSKTTWTEGWFAPSWGVTEGNPKGRPTRPGTAPSSSSARWWASRNSTTDSLTALWQRLPVRDLEGGTDQRRAAVGKWQLPICRSALAEHPCPTRANGARTDASTLHANDQIINIAWSLSP